MAKKVQKWESKSGELFNTRREALRDDEICETLAFFEDNPIYGNFEGCKVYGSDIREYLDENKEVILKYYGIKLEIK